MPLSSSRTLVALLAAAAFTTFGIVCPQAARADDAADAADTGVARLSFIRGPVAVQRGDSTSPSDAVVNAPVLGADYLTTGEGARAEVQFDAATMVRLGSNVQVRFTRLNPGNRTFQLAEGTIEVRMLRRYDGDVEIDTPSVGVRPREAGSYRVTVTPDGQTLVTVRSGAADVLTPQGDQSLGPGRTLLAQGAASSPSIRTVAEIAPDDFDRFNRDRDGRAAAALARTSGYVSPSVPGLDDLDQYGRWVEDPRYGAVWAPAVVAAGWAPYRDGRWFWEDGYGWTWLGYEPWGWAPYHYGRWFHSAANGWCWDPPRGPFIVEPWRPALVAFLGFGGPGVSLGIGFGNVGWVPLGPTERFHPWWGPTAVNNVTITNVNITNVYNNAQYGGVTAVPGRRFLLGRFDHPTAVRPEQLGDVHVMRGTVPAVPTAANLRFSDRSAPSRLVLRAPFTQRTFAGDGVVVPRTPFEQQRTAVSNVTRLPAQRIPETMRFAPTVHAVRPQSDRATIQRSTTGDPWSRFDQIRGTAPTIRREYAPAAQGRATGVRVPTEGAWRRFDANGGGRSTAPNPAYGTPNRGNTVPARSYTAPTRVNPPSRAESAPHQSVRSAPAVMRPAPPH
jgi:hypothetical protein